MAPHRAALAQKAAVPSQRCQRSGPRSRAPPAPPQGEGPGAAALPAAPQHPGSSAGSRALPSLVQEPQASSLHATQSARCSRTQVVVPDPSSRRTRAPKPCFGGGLNLWASLQITRASLSTAVRPLPKPGSAPAAQPAREGPPCSTNPRLCSLVLPGWAGELLCLQI